MFYSKLNFSNITDEDYEHAKIICSIFQINNLQEYAELFFNTDVFLLPDVFENFRKTCKITCNSDSAHYFAAPGLSFAARLKLIDVVLELFIDIDMHLFIESV